MTIQLVDLARLSKRIQKTIVKKITEVIAQGRFVNGKEVADFEKQFATYIGTKYCVGVGSGTDALHLSFLALGFKKGDEVIVPAMTFIASISPLLHMGVNPILVDVDDIHGNIEVKDVEKAITKKTKAILVVHLHGYPAAMIDLVTLAKKYKLFLIEDASQAHGSLYDQKKIGSFGDLATFSFYPGKNLGAFGEAGAIMTNNKKLQMDIIKLRNHGEEKKYKHILVGFNSRLDTIQAIVLSVKLLFLDAWNKKRRMLVHHYVKLLAPLPLRLPTEEAKQKTNYHIFAIRTSKRDQLRHYLEKLGIHAGVHYPYPLHLQPALKQLGYKKGDFPKAEEFAQTTLSLPLFPELSVPEVTKIVSSIQAFFEKEIKQIGQRKKG